MPTAEKSTGLRLDEIILATDFKPTSEAATKFAQTIAEHFSATTTVANVIDLSVATRSEASMAGWPIEAMRQDSADQMSKTLNRFITRSLNVRGQKLESYNPAQAIVELAEKIEADLIVMGTHSRQGLSKMILGSCSDGVIHHASCPVITIGPKAASLVKEKFHLKTIVLATDLWRDASEKVAKAFALAQESAAKVYICHIMDGGNVDLEDMHTVPAGVESSLRDLLPDSMFEHTPECIVEFGSASKHILKIASHVGADLIVLGAQRGGSYFSHWNSGVVNGVLAEASCPVMTICVE